MTKRNNHSSYATARRQRRADVVRIQDAIKSIDLRDFEHADTLSSSLARYLVVRSAGYLEAVRDDLADEFVRKTSHPRVHNYVSSGLRVGQGVHPDQLREFLRRFDATWSEQFDEFLQADDGRLSSDLGALVHARKKIAHGDGETITETKAQRYADSALKIGRWLENLFGSNDFRSP